MLLRGIFNKNWYLLQYDMYIWSDLHIFLKFLIKMTANCNLLKYISIRKISIRKWFSLLVTKTITHITLEILNSKTSI